MLYKEEMYKKSFWIWCLQHALKKVGTRACLPPSYITFPLPTLTNSLGTRDSNCCFCLIPAGRITAVAPPSEGIWRLVFWIFPLIYTAGLQRGHSRACYVLVTPAEYDILVIWRDSKSVLKPGLFWFTTFLHCKDFSIFFWIFRNYGCNLMKPQILRWEMLKNWTIS